MHTQTKRLSALLLALLLLCQLCPALAVQAPALVTGTRETVDFSCLQSINPQCVGWLYQPQSGDSVPVMQGKTDKYYADHSFEDTSMTGGGTAFIRTDASAAFSESLLWIYGNSGRGNAPFQWMGQYTDQTYYEEHSSFRLITPSGQDWQLDVFACVRSMRKPDAFFDPAQSEDGFGPWLESLLEVSAITPKEDSLPVEGQRLAMLANDTGGVRTVLCATVRPIRYTGGETVNLVKQELDSRETVSGYQQVGTLGAMMVYAQNDPVWEKMRYESESAEKFRNLGGGGCGPLSVAIAVANLVPMEQLPRLKQHSANGFGTLFCTCSVNRYYCNRQHAPYLLETAEEYLRYLPVAMADFAAGNNEWKIRSRYGNSRGTNMTFLQYVCDVYGLQMEVIKKLSPALERLKGQAGHGLVVCCALKGPFTASSHYVVIAGLDEEYAYILDPLFRTQEEYTQDIFGVVEVLTPGVVRVGLDKIGDCSLVPTAYIENPSLGTDWAIGANAK